MTCTASGERESNSDTPTERGWERLTLSDDRLPPKLWCRWPKQSVTTSVMNNSRSDSSENTSIYETPITSPLNESLANSTRIGSSLFSPTSLTSPVFDLLDGRQSMDSMATESTLRQTVRQLNSQEGQHLTAIDASIGQSWLSQLGRRLSLRDTLHADSNDPLVKLKILMAEVDNDVVELIGIEQQIQSISLKCRSIRDEIISKSNAIHSLISEISSNPKQTAQKQTQTESSDIKSDTKTKDRHTISSSHVIPKEYSRLSMTSDARSSVGTTTVQVSQTDTNSVGSNFEVILNYGLITMVCLTN